MLDLRVALAIACASMSFCACDPIAQHDELDRQGDVPVEWVSDAGVEDFAAFSPEGAGEVEVPTHFGCNDGCAQVCAPEQACCRSTQQCMSLENRGLCPDANFGFDQLSLGGH